MFGAMEHHSMFGIKAPRNIRRKGATLQCHFRAGLELWSTMQEQFDVDPALKAFCIS
jgi:hypothetical protein